MDANLLFQTPTANPFKLKQCYSNGFRFRFLPQPVQLRSTVNRITELQSRRLITTSHKSDSSLFQCRTTEGICEETRGNKKVWKFAGAVVLGGVLMLINGTKPALAAGRVRATSPPPIEEYNDYIVDYYKSQSGRYLAARKYSKSLLFFQTWGFVIIAFVIYYVGLAELHSMRVADSVLKRYDRRGAFILGFIVLGHSVWAAHYDPSTVVKLQLQVKLSNAGRALQTELNQIAETADTSTFEGVNRILTETTKSILKRPKCFISASTYVSNKYGRNGAQNYLDQLSLQERIKIGEKLLDDVNNLKEESLTSSKSANEIRDEHLEVTILVALKAKRIFPTISSWDDLKEVLQLLTSINPEDGIYPYGVEVLWNPKSSSSTGRRY